MEIKICQRQMLKKLCLFEDVLGGFYFGLGNFLYLVAIWVEMRCNFIFGILFDTSTCNFGSFFLS